jgi:hypothetical protein
MNEEVQVEEINGIEYYSLETPEGRRWSWDEEEVDEPYIEDTLWAWSRFLDFVRARDVS